MGRLAAYLQDEPQPQVTQIDFGDRVTSTVAQVVAQEAVTRLTPYIQALLETMQAGGDRVEAGADRATRAVDAATKALEGAVAGEVKTLKADLNKAVKALNAASERDAKALMDGVAKAVGGLDIPDYSDQLAKIAAAQPVILSAIKDNEPDERPLEWDFDIKRNRSGFIQSVTAKAK